MAVASVRNVVERSIFEQPEKVSFSTVSFFKSQGFSLLAKTGVLIASVTWVLPMAASLIHATLPPLLIKSLLVAVVVGVAFFGLRIKKKLVYEISLLYTIYGSKSWWNKISENIVLGAIPLQHQRDKLKNGGITHVISTMEPFELKPGLVRPVQPFQWKEVKIAHKYIEAVDFIGMPADQIHEAVEYMHQEIQKNGKFYVHCKAGRGRSVTVVVTYLWKYDSQNFATKEEAYAYVKKIRPQVNLNANQMNAIQNYINTYPK